MKLIKLTKIELLDKIENVAQIYIDKMEAIIENAFGTMVKVKMVRHDMQNTIHTSKEQVKDIKNTNYVLSTK